MIRTQLLHVVTLIYFNYITSLQGRASTVAFGSDRFGPKCC